MPPDSTQANIATTATEQVNLALAPPHIAQAILSRRAIPHTRRVTLDLPDRTEAATHAAMYWRRAGRTDIADLLDPYGSASAATKDDLSVLARLLELLHDPTAPALAHLRFVEGQRSYDCEPILGIFSDGTSRFLGSWTHIAQLPEWAYGFTLIPLDATLEEAMRADWISPAELLATADILERHHLTLLGDVWERAVSTPPHNEDMRRGPSWALLTSAP